MKNKIISILCIFILISFIFINTAFAYAVTSTDDIKYIEINNEKLNAIIRETQERFVEDDYYYVVGYERGTSKYTLIYFNKSSVTISPYLADMNYSNGDYDYYAIVINSGETFNIATYYIDSDFSSYEFFGISTNNKVQAFTIPSGNTEAEFLSNFKVLTSKNSNVYFNVYIEEDITILPAISNTAEDLATGIFDYILVAPGTFSNTENIGLNIYNITNLEEGADVYSQKPLFTTTLNSSSSYYNSIVVEDQTEFWYEIPRANLNIDFKNGNTYFYSLLLDGSPIQEVQATIGGLTEEDILNNNFDNLQTSINQSNKELQDTIKESNKEVQESIDKQTEAIKENNKTNKNIFEKIGEILSYLNPFSENFFAYKLVELIVDGLKSLFVPADDFFGLYFDELNNWFSDRLGFLYYPLELLFDLLDRFLNINFAEPIINIPDIKEPFTNVTLIKSASFNFNDLLENETLKNVHDIYFIIVDAFIYIGLVGLLYRKYEEVMTK